MIEYEVTIEERPLGVRFAHADRGETVIVHLVLENKVGHKLGLLPGDILIAINGKSVLDISSSEALELFRGQDLPFKATFRRFEDDDDFDSEAEEHSETDLASHIQQEDVNSIMHQLSSQPQYQKTGSVTMHNWTTEDVTEFLINFGKSSFNDPNRFAKYKQLISDNNIDGKALANMGRDQLQKLGVDEADVKDLYRGIQQIKAIVVANKNNAAQGHLASQLKKQNDAQDDDAKQEEEDDNWEAPFLPYMYDAPQIKLSDQTIVKVYSARVVSPYKKKAFALYELEVIEGKDEWLLSKRYSEFNKLYQQIKNLGVKTKISFPKKGLFYKSTDKQVMEERKMKLTQYLNELLKDHPKARDSRQLLDFLSPSRTFVVDE